MADKSGIYQGVIEDNKDPQKRGRNRVRILGLHTDATPIEKLPWAEPMAVIGGNDSINYMYKAPIGTTVYVSFINGETASPVIVGYWRRNNKEIWETSNHLDSKKDHAFWYMKFGVKKDAPILKFDAMTETIQYGTGQNLTSLGKSTRLMSENGTSNTEMDKVYALIQYKRNVFQGVGQPPADNFISLNGNGIDVTASNAINIYAPVKRTMTIGGGLSMASVGSQLFSMIPGVGDAMRQMNSSGLTPSKELGKLNKILQSNKNNWDAKQPFMKNIFKSIKGSVADRGGEIKKIFSNMSRGGKDLLAAVKYSTHTKGGAKRFLAKLDMLGKKDPAIWNVATIVDEIMVKGTRKTTIIGDDDKTVNKSSNDKVTANRTVVTMGTYKSETSKNHIVILNGMIGSQMKFLVKTGDLVFNVASGKSEMVIGLNTNAFSIYHKIGTPVNYLTKKSAWNGLLSIIEDLVTFSLGHMHPTAVVGPPSPPVGIPPTLSATIPIKLGAVKTLGSVTPPGSIYFTNALKVG